MASTRSPVLAQLGPLTTWHIDPQCALKQCSLQPCCWLSLEAAQQKLHVAQNRPSAKPLNKRMVKVQPGCSTDTRMYIPVLSPATAIKLPTSVPRWATHGNG
jgi:hypothetical protein